MCRCRAAIDRRGLASRVPAAEVQGACVLDPYGAGGWAPQPHSLYGAAGGPPHWCERPGRSSDPVTPVGGPLRQAADSPFHATCPVHSPFRFRFVNGGPDFHLHHQHQVILACRRYLFIFPLRGRRRDTPLGPYEWVVAVGVSCDGIGREPRASRSRSRSTFSAEFTYSYAMLIEYSR